MKAKFLLLVLFISISSYSQISFEKGYFISNEGQKTECLIRNLDWSSNPTNFDFKLTETDEIQKTDITKVKEFSINNISTFKRFTVKMDRSSELAQNLSREKNPIFKEETLFLRVLVDGKASLFSYKEVNLYRYFFSIDNSNVEQLIFKSYLFDKATQDKTSNSNNTGELAYSGVSVNNTFKQQLFNSLKSENISLKEIEALRYNEEELKNLFIKYEKNSNVELKQYSENIKRDYFNIYARIGLSNSSFSIHQLTNVYNNPWNVDMENQSNIRLGLEFEFVMPYNKNKWSLIAEPTYENFKSEKFSNNRTTNVDYKSFNLPIGVRHYMFLNKNTKLFVNALYNFSFSQNSKISNKFGNQLNNYNEIDPSGNFVLGCGISFKDKINLEFRYGFKRSIWNYVFYEATYESASLIFGYNLF
jgi:hypothetical protein